MTTEQRLEKVEGHVNKIHTKIDEMHTYLVGDPLKGKEGVHDMLKEIKNQVKQTNDKVKFHTKLWLIVGTGAAGGALSLVVWLLKRGMS